MHEGKVKGDMAVPAKEGSLTWKKGACNLTSPTWKASVPCLDQSLRHPAYTIVIKTRVLPKGQVLAEPGPHQEIAMDDPALHY
eukprot:1143041-Pelagomonas_calceolata.AAC.2